MKKKLIAEFIGTYVLVFAGSGAIVMVIWLQSSTCIWGCNCITYI